MQHLFEQIMPIFHLMTENPAFAAILGTHPWATRP